MRNHPKSIFVLAVIMAFVAVGLVMTAPARANNIQVANVVPVEQDTSADVINIQFDLSWDNSWRVSPAQAPSNWDAAWVFAKWRVQGGTVWNHCTLSTTDLDHTAPAGSEIDASFSKDNDGKGVFIYRSSEGSGSNDWDGVKLLWNYGTDGMGDNDVIEIRVFAIEMVYIPQDTFYLGDGSSYGTFRQTGSNTPVQITTTPVVVKCENTAHDDPQLEGAGILVDGDGGIDMDGTSVVDNTDYPTGYGSFYCMKYELSQGQYTDFLNTLNRIQQNIRTETDVSTDVITDVFVMSGTSGVTNRNTIECPPNGNGTTDPIVFTASAPDRACNFITWADDAAYADWAGLRPMTELEFEKACRGPQSPVAGEYAWGNANIAGSAYTLANDGQPNEGIATNYATDPSGNASYETTVGSIDGPLRCGIFATGSSSRVEAGAGYYGVMEMSGNLFERQITLGTSTGRGFTGAHGDGALEDGDADVLNWPGTDAVGSGLRSGAYINLDAILTVSRRDTAARDETGRLWSLGFRAGRTP
jgi:formylglycine-generating enzyme required for sulfatase activity